MSFSPVPKASFPALTNITVEFLEKWGITFLMLDLDNTIAPYGQEEPTRDIISWAEDMRERGIELFIVSNSRRPERVEAFATALGIGYIKAAGKPSPRGVLQSLEVKNEKPEESALIGDQVYTDVLAANRAGVFSIVIEPINLSNSLLTVRYWLEKPFRAMCKQKYQ